MIKTVAWWAVLVAVALVVVGLQTDRQTRRTPAVAVSVPEAFRSAAQLPIAAYAVAGDDHESALAEAEKLVRRRPLPAEHLRVLAQAQFLAGDVAGSSLSIQYAAQRGWRDPLAQETMLRLALEAGNTSEAARRYAALFLRRDTQDVLLQELGPPVLAETGGEGRQTLIDIVGGGERWHNQFLGRGARVMPADAFVEIVGATIENGTRYECRMLEQALRGVTARDEASGAAFSAIIDDHC
ncbi:MAG: hypothetical protein ABJN35_06100 [Erythrobacter sp.]